MTITNDATKFPQPPRKKERIELLKSELRKGNCKTLEEM